MPKNFTVMTGGSLGQNKWPRSEWRVAVSGRLWEDCAEPHGFFRISALLCNSLSAALSAPAPQVVIFGVYSLSFPSGSSVESSGNQAGCCREMSLLLWSKRPWRPRDSSWLHPSHCPGPGVGTAHMLMWEVRFVLPITRGGEGKGQSGREQRTLCTEPCDLSPLARHL